MTQIPPGKYFISHSYRDADVRDQMIDQLPDGVEAFIFPPINVTPMEFVSNSLIGAILACDGMIYLNEGASARSFWVAFERDYALRSGKPVYAYTPSEAQLEAHDAPPLDLVVFPSYTRRDQATVRPVLNFMSQRRNFDVWLDEAQLNAGANWATQIESGIRATIDRGGYVVTFWGGSESPFVMEETEYGLRENRVIVAGLGARPPEFIMRYQGMFVPLVEGGAVNNNRIDDLIVRLYWLIFRNQAPELGYE